MGTDLVDLVEYTGQEHQQPPNSASFPQLRVPMFKELIIVGYRGRTSSVARIDVSNLNVQMKEE